MDINAIHKNLDLNFSYNYVTAARIILSISNEKEGNKTGYAIVSLNELEKSEDQIVDFLQSKAKLKNKHKDESVSVFEVTIDNKKYDICICNDQCLLSSNEFNMLSKDKSVSNLIEEFKK